MPPINPGLPGSTSKSKPKPAARRGAVGRGADIIKPTAGPPAPKPKPTGVFKPGATTRPATARLTQDAPRAAQRKVDTARRALPPATVAAPPVVNTRGTGKPTGKPIAPRQVQAFLKSQSKVTAAARGQLVKSIRQNVGDVHGAARVEAIDRLIREIATDPRHAATRKAIEHYTALERETARPQTAVAKPGPQPRKAKLGVGPIAATVNLTAASQALTKAAEKAAPGLTSGSPEAQIFRNAFKDVGTLGKAPFVGGYAVGSAIYQDTKAELTGDTKNAGKRSTELVKGILGGAAEEVKHPVKSLKEHPVLTLLDAAGAVSAVGRHAGAAARGVGKKGAGGVRGALDEHSHTVRPPLALVDDSGQPVLVQRTGSKDLTRRAVQAASDRGRETVKGPDGKTVYVTDRGRRVPVLKATEAERARHFKKRGDMVASRANSRERVVREETVRASKVKGVKGKAAKDIVAMAVEGTLTSATHFADDLRKVRDDTAARIARHESGAEPFRHSGDLEAAKENLAQAERILRNPKAMRQGPAIIAEAERHGARLREGDAASVEGQIGDEAALNRAALSTTALQHLGARHFTVEEHQALERDARKAEAAAVAKYEAEHSGGHESGVFYHASRSGLSKAGRETTSFEVHGGTRRAAMDRAKAFRGGDHKLEAFRLPEDAKVPSGKEKGSPENPFTEAEMGTLPPHMLKAAGVSDWRYQQAVRELRDRGYDAVYYRNEIEHKGSVSVLALDRRRLKAVDLPAMRNAALAELDTAREARIAVSGREPVGTRAHETAKHGHAVAAARLQRATEAEAKAEARVRDLVVRHKSERAKEAHHGPVAAYYVGPDRFTLRADAITHAKAHGIPLRDIKRVATTSGEAKRVGEISQARRALAAAKTERRDAAKAVRAGEQHVKAHPLPDTNAALRYGEDSAHLGKKPGEYLSNQDIEDFLTSRGRDPKTVAHLTHRQNNRGARAHHAQLRPGNRPRLDGGETRTGSAYLDRVTESSQALIRDEGVRQATQLNKAKALDRVVAENGLRHPAWAKAKAGHPLTPGEQRVVDEGGLFKAKEALETATRLEKDTGQRFTPMTAYQARLSEDTQRIIRENLQGPNGMETLPQRLLNDRIVQPSAKPDTRARNVVLVPSELVERLEEHLRPAGQVEKFFQYLNKPFRMAVLPQPRWLNGNFFESYIVRLPTVGSGINIPGLLMDVHSYRQGMKALRNGTPEMQEAARLIEAQQTGSGLFVGGKSSGVRRTVDEALPQFAQRAYGKVVAKMPVTAQMAELAASAVHWIAMPLHAFFWINQKFIENPAQRIAFGHSFRRDLQAITGSWIKSVVSGTAAAADAAKGLVGTPAQERFMHDQYELLGKYSGQSPTLRAFTQSVAPFLPWMLNAARFVYWTMPAHNTVKTALLVKAYEVVQQDWDDIHRGNPPGGLKDAIPTPNGGWLDLARYTPWGLTAPIASGGNLASIPAQFTPQFGGAANALAGRDPFGRPLKVQPSASNPKGTPSNADLVKSAAYNLLEAVTPYMSTARRLQEHGETSFADSTVFSPKTKPGTSHGQTSLERTFSPFRATYLGGPSPSPAAARFAKARQAAAPAATPDPQEALLDNLYNSLDTANADQAMQDQLLNNLYGDGG